MRTKVFFKATRSHGFTVRCDFAMPNVCGIIFEDSLDPRLSFSLPRNINFPLRFKRERATAEESCETNILAV